MGLMKLLNIFSLTNFTTDHFGSLPIYHNSVTGIAITVQFVRFVAFNIAMCRAFDEE